ncbi:MAG: hypothetical protein ABEJ92_02065 [Halobacteriales archaeon]
MSAIPGGLATDQQPPMTIPLRHFLVGLGFLVLAVVLGTLAAAEPTLASGSLAHVHLALVGWVCVTIMGAMTQFVPVWSGTQLHSRRLAVVQLWLVTAGLLGFAAALLAGRLAWLPAFGALMLAGFWVFAYNIARTLAGAAPYDVTERHFLVALGFFVLLTVLGFLLALDFAVPFLGDIGLPRPRVVMAHATLAVFGAVLTTVFGALYQLATMFTQTELGRVDVALQRFEEAAYPVGVLALAGGRLGAFTTVATVGGLLVAAGALCVAVVLARRLLSSQVGWSPMLRRYAAVVPATAAWAALAVPVWIARPLAPAALLGAPGAGHLLVVGVVGFVVLGTLYHVVPFIIWVHRYSDRLGLEPVPMVDDLYHERLAHLEFVVTGAGGLALIVAEYAAVPRELLVAAGALTAVGLGVFSVTLLLVVRDHSPQSVRELLLGRLAV